MKLGDKTKLTIRGYEIKEKVMEKYSMVPRTKLFKGRYTELTIFWYKLQLRFSLPQTAAWWDGKRLYDFGRGHNE